MLRFIHNATEKQDGPSLNDYRYNGPKFGRKLLTYDSDISGFSQGGDGTDI